MTKYYFLILGLLLMSPVFCWLGASLSKFRFFEESDFKPSISDVTSLITDKSRVMILNYPNSPTDSILSYDEVAALSKFAVERDSIVISGEVYERIVYDDAKHYCPATFPGMLERTLSSTPSAG